ncbi:oligosaccharide flippase family protein [Pseudoalteromonas sp. SR43-3]|uniref:oligosaccharide flippase family protein n=1 Tax=Pseudoalteromonas sp. SR43-3 TaxID=2760943 RepID=UPI0016008E61|nr:oligosaccharide flippase family protein [Pseudoalteromonas sp. SR43-3]MBB1275947.1 oligosaccharide flippase family protein [Pseudoalteromonas sp. SR43-3]
MLNKKIFHSFVNLSFIQIANLFSPLIIYPFLIHNYGVNDFGIIVFHQGIIAFFAIVINFGFYITGAKDVAQNLDSFSDIVSNIFTIKIILWLGSLIIVCIISLLNFSTVNSLLLFICFFSTFYELLFVQWFFQGVENLKWITLINTAGKVLLTILCLTLINANSTIYLVPLIFAIVNLLTGLSSIFLMYKIYRVNYIIPQRQVLLHYFKNASPIFISNITVSIKDRASTILIGSFLGMSAVAIYDLSIRLLNLVSIPISVYSDAVFPKAVKIRSNTLLKRSIFLIFFASLLIVLIALYFLPYFVSMFAGEDMLIGLDAYYIMMSALPIVSVSLIIARLGLLVFNHNKIYMKIMFLTVYFYIGSVFFGYLLNLLGSLSFYVYLAFSSYLVEMLLRAYFSRKLRVL